MHQSGLATNLLFKNKNSLKISSKDVRHTGKKTVFLDTTLIDFWYDVENKTHSGAIYCKIVEEIPVVYLRVILSSTEKTLIDVHVNLCTWLKNKKIEYMINLLKFLDSVLNKQIFKCPYKKGQYTLFKSRLMPQTVEDYGGIPLYMPIKGNFNLTLVGKTKIRKRTRLMFNHYELFELS